MNKSQSIKVILACVALLSAGGLLLGYATSSGKKVTGKQLSGAIKAMSDDELVAMRQALFIRIRSTIDRHPDKPKSERVQKSEKTLEGYDIELRSRGIDPDKLTSEAQKMAEAPQRPGEGP